MLTLAFQNLKHFEAKRLKHVKPVSLWELIDCFEHAHPKEAATLADNIENMSFEVGNALFLLRERKRPNFGQIPIQKFGRSSTFSASLIHSEGSYSSGKLVSPYMYEPSLRG